MEVKRKPLAMIAAGAIVVAAGAAGVYWVKRPKPLPQYPLFDRSPESQAAWARAQGQVPLQGRPDDRPKDLSTLRHFPLRDIDRRVLEFLKSSPGAAGDDVLPKETAKVSVYHPGRGAEVKIDLDRDGRIEERWSVTPERTERDVVVPGRPGARFGDEYVLDADQWALTRGKGATAALAPPPAGTPPPPAEEDLRPMDKQILDLIAKSQHPDGIQDAFPKAPYHVELDLNRDKTRIERVRIDLDRDNQWDEQWFLPSQRIVNRTILSGNARYELQSGKWVKI